MLGLRPTTTGSLRTGAVVPHACRSGKDRVSLPQHFANHGYRTAATGKIYHGGTGGAGRQGQRPESSPPSPSSKSPRPSAASAPGRRKKLIPPTPMGNNPLMDWGVWPLDNDDTGKGDYQVASWTIEQIKNAPKDQPFFIAAGFFLPHVPLLRHPEVVRPLSG